MQLNKKLNQKFPQNYIIRKPLTGFLIIAFFIFGFVLLYKPLGAHGAGAMSFELTMAIYSFTAALFVLVIVRLLKSLNYFSNEAEWTIVKELVAIFIILVGIGVVIYFLGFFIEEPDERWNLVTFFDSVKSAFLIGILPFAFFSAVGLSRFFSYSSAFNDEFSSSVSEGKKLGELININSKLKKEDLSFYSEEFIYAASDGNYVDFFLGEGDRLYKKTIRNSISNVEQQLRKFPHFLKTHRAFIVNLKKVEEKRGNTLGYRLKLFGIEEEIPVARKKVPTFDQRFEQIY